MVILFLMQSISLLIFSAQNVAIHVDILISALIFGTTLNCEDRLSKSFSRLVLFDDAMRCSKTNTLTYMPSFYYFSCIFHHLFSKGNELRFSNITLISHISSKSSVAYLNSHYLKLCNQFPLLSMLCCYREFFVCFEALLLQQQYLLIH